MATNIEIEQRISQLYTRITNCLEKCYQYEAPTPERIDRVQELRSRCQQLAAKATQLKISHTNTIRNEISTKQAELNAINERVNQLQQQINDHQNDYSIQTQKLQSAINATPDPTARQNLSRQLQEANQRHSTTHTDLQEQLRNLQKQDAPAISRETRALEIKRNEKDAEWGQMEAEVEIRAIEAELRQVLADAGAFERTILEGRTIQQRAESDFALKAKEFQDAETFHRDSARNLFIVMMGTAMIACYAILKLFLLYPPSLSADVLATAEHGPVGTRGAIDAVERIAMLGVGRVAVLFFLGWALRYLGALHKSHAEQAVLYRDRKAALGVVETILSVTPDPKQKQDFLHTLSRGYLDFEHNAFRVKSQGGDAGRHTNTRQLREVLKAVQPLLDTVKGMADRRP